MRAIDASCAALCLFLPIACARADGEPRGATRTTDEPRAASDAPLILELFTSQGCSSCPPADRLLAKLAADGALGDRAVAPLAFHVDYWNDLGWADPFSLPAWSERQRQYARALDGRVYTPELVIGGAAAVIGSNLTAVADAIHRVPRPAALTAAANWTPSAVTVAATAPDGADVWVAVWEDGTTTQVARGENAGETMVGQRVVRRLERVAAAGTAGSITVAFTAAWRAGGAVAFAQRSDRSIAATALLRRP